MGSKCLKKHQMYRQIQQNKEALFQIYGYTVVKVFFMKPTIYTIYTINSLRLMSLHHTLLAPVEKSKQQTHNMVFVFLPLARNKSMLEKFLMTDDLDIAQCQI